MSKKDLHTTDIVIHLLDNPSEVLDYTDKWWCEAKGHVDEIGVEPPSKEFRKITRVLMAWADHNHIGDVGCMWKLETQIITAFKSGQPSGLRQPNNEIKDTLNKAMCATFRIDDAATIMFNRTATGKNIAKKVIDYVAQYEADGGDVLELRRDGIANALQVSGSSVSATPMWQEIAEKKRQDKTPPTIEAQLQKAIEKGDWKAVEAHQRREEKQHRQYKS